MPSVFRRPVIGSREELTRLRGLGSILKEQGWSTSFHYAAEQTIMGFDSYSRMSGFDVYRSEADYPDRSEAVRDGRWGIFDHLFYADTLAWLDREKTPFLTLIFSLSPHDPYKLPPGLEKDYAAYAHETGYQRCLRYSDWALGRFFEAGAHEALVRRHALRDHGRPHALLAAQRLLPGLPGAAAALRAGLHLRWVHGAGRGRPDRLPPRSPADASWTCSTSRRSTPRWAARCSLPASASR